VIGLNPTIWKGTMQPKPNVIASAYWLSRLQLRRHPRIVENMSEFGFVLPKIAFNEDYIPKKMSG
jgi:hypothetical protein